MKNFKSEGEVVTFTAPSGGVVSGQLVIIGALALIPAFSAAEGYECEGVTRGVFELPKTATDTPTQFAAAYWNATAGEVTTTASGNKKIGVFMDALEAGTATADVRLSGVAV